MAKTDEFLTEYLSWENSPLMACEECLEIQESTTPPRDCPDCGYSLCFDCAEEHDCEDEDDEDFDEDEWDDEDEEDEDDEDEDDEEEWES